MPDVDVVVIGGGYTGALFAIHLSRQAQRDLDIAIVEPRRRPGGGVAYDTTDPDHRLNGPLTVHFVYPDAPDHLHSWYLDQQGPERDPEALAPDGNFYIRRKDFGRYVAEQFDTHVEGNASGSRIGHIRSRGIAALRTADGYEVTLDDGQTLSARLAVLATGHESPDTPRPFASIAAARRGFLADPWKTDHLYKIPANARVLVLGMAQTASDVIASLLRSGYCGTITVVSRHGLRPRRRPLTLSGQMQFLTERLDRPVSLFSEAHGPHMTVRSLLQTLRSDIRQAEADGSSWVEPFANLRDSVWDVWPALPTTEKRRFLRHLRTWYDVHRFQLPPQTEQRIVDAETAGQLTFSAEDCESVTCNGGVFSVTLRHRGSMDRTRVNFDAIVNCTGPGIQPERSSNPIVRSLLAGGHATIHPTGIGFNVDPECRAIDTVGNVDPLLRIVGPLTYGALGDQQGAAFIALRLCRIMPGIATSLGRKQ